MAAKRPCPLSVVYSGDEEIFPLQITPGYVPKWQAWEGVREFVQNWHDGVLSTFEQAGGAADRSGLLQQGQLVTLARQTNMYARTFARTAYCILF